MKTAVAYVSDIILGRTGEVIKRSCQRELIQQYAAENGIEIVRWFEDEMYDEEVLHRAGVQMLLAYDQPYDLLLCERVWAFSRSIAILEPFFAELDRRHVKLECATTMWDCVSQKCRHRFLAPHREPRRAEAAAAPPVPAAKTARPGRKPHHVARPAHLHFAHTVR